MSSLVDAVPLTCHVLIPGTPGVPASPLLPARPLGPGMPAHGYWGVFSVCCGWGGVGLCLKHVAKINIIKP